MSKAGLRRRFARSWRSAKRTSASCSTAPGRRYARPLSRTSRREEVDELPTPHRPRLQGAGRAGHQLPRASPLARGANPLRAPPDDVHRVQRVPSADSQYDRYFAQARGTRVAAHGTERASDGIPEVESRLME